MRRSDEGPRLYGPYEHGRKCTSSLLQDAASLARRDIACLKRGLKLTPTSKAAGTRRRARR